MRSPDELDQIANPIGPKGKPSFVVIVGRKGSGKSVRALSIWQHWPQRRIVIDVTGSLTKAWLEGRPLLGPACEYFGAGTKRRQLPREWPMHEDTRRPVMELCFWPDASTLLGQLEEVDRAIDLALRTEDCLIWVDEATIVLPGSLLDHKMPAARKLLNHGRHAGVSGLFAGPRVVTMHTLVLAQADHVLCYRQQSIADIDRIADATGINKQDLRAELAALQEHCYAWWNSTHADELSIYPPCDPPRQLKRPLPVPSRRE